MYFLEEISKNLPTAGVRNVIATLRVLEIIVFNQICTSNTIYIIYKFFIYFALKFTQKKFQPAAVNRARQVSQIKLLCITFGIYIK